MTQNTNPWATQIDPLAQDIAALSLHGGDALDHVLLMSGPAHALEHRGDVLRQRIDLICPRIGVLSHSGHPLVLDTDEPVANTDEGCKRDREFVIGANMGEPTGPLSVFDT